MSSRSIETLLVAGVAATSVLLGMPSASAASTFDVTAGSARPGAEIDFALTSQGSSPQVTFTDTTTGIVFNCVSSAATGQITVGRGQSGRGLGTINGADTTFDGCTGPLGLNLIFSNFGAWEISVLRGNSQTVFGAIAGVRAFVTDSGGGSQCRFNVTGSTEFQYDNASARLSLPGTQAQLRVSNVRGCFGFFFDDDRLSLRLSYGLVADRAAFNPVRIAPSP